MIQKIITDGKYEFNGNLKELYKCINSFKIIKVMCDTVINGVMIYEAIGSFRYHKQIHHIHISKHWGGEDKLFITYEGGK